MKHKVSWRKALGLAAVAVTLGLGPAILSGCSGSANILGPGGPVVNGNFTGAAANLGGGRTGTLQLQTFTDNSVDGTLTVNAAAALLGGRALTGDVGPRAVSLPVGVYNINGTRSGNTVTGHAVYTGTPAATYDFTANLSTSTTAGTWTISGTLNGEPFNFNGSINVNANPNPTTPGGGGGNGSFTFSANNSNATTTALAGNVGVGIRSTLGTAQILSATFTSATSATNLRNLTINLTKNSAFAVNDEFTLSDSTSNTAGNGHILYGEGVPTNKAWISTGGRVRITAISGNSYTLQVTLARMEPAPLAGPGQTNQATGAFTLMGSGTVTVP